MTSAAQAEIAFLVSGGKEHSDIHEFLDTPAEDLLATSRPVQHRDSGNRIGVELARSSTGLRPLVTDSRNEAAAVRFLTWVRTTTAMAAQPVELHFTLEDGRDLMHRLDLLVDDHDGQRTLVDVKPRRHWDPAFALQALLTSLWCEGWGLHYAVFSEPTQARTDIQILIRNHTIAARRTRGVADDIYSLLNQPRSCHYLAHRVGGYARLEPALMHLLAHHQVHADLNSTWTSYTRVRRGEPGRQDQAFVHSATEVLSTVAAQHKRSEPSRARSQGLQISLEEST